jgi:hypothetical protein
MTARDAYLKVLSKMGGMRALVCYEYDSVYVFQMAPSHLPRNSKPLTGLTSVNKKTGEVKRFLPIDIGYEEYARGKRLTESEYGGV